MTAPQHPTRSRRLMHWRECGGCAGLGAHRRWCPAEVGEQAAYFGQLSEKAESLGDSIGPNDMGAANVAWQLAATLGARAIEDRDAHYAQVAGCDCTTLCSMGPTCPGGMLADLPGSGCWRAT